ncbi:MAG: HupE/UreJ family protein [Myxococcales bacterium]|nr:HupE/UreJ family protein [Myxococcales bacterium]
MLAFLAWAAGGPQRAQAHEVRPGYLELSAIGGDVWNVLWKVPAKGENRLGLYVRLPQSCEGTEPAVRKVGAAYVERWRATCSDGLVGESISIEGLAATRTDVLVRVQHLDGTTQTVRLTPGRPAFEVAGSPSQIEVATTYLGLGVEHILGGVDHLLFVLALLFLVGSVRKLVATITAFTAAHSLTLVAATLGWLHVPSAPVEAVIALSIVFVAAEVLRDSDSAGLAKRKPWLVALAFGLLHGLGFAGALSDVGLPSHAIPIALAFFNIGVEAGQLIFITAALCVFTLASAILRIRPQARKSGIWAVAEVFAYPAAYSIGILGAFWLIERTASFWDMG